MRSNALRRSYQFVQRGCLNFAKGNKAAAEELYRRALTIKEKLLGPQHADVAMTLNNLAVLLKGDGRCVEAEDLYQRSLLIFERELGPEHPKVITCRQNYVRLLRKIGREHETAVFEARPAAE